MRNTEILSAWNGHLQLPFPESVIKYHSAPENKDKQLMLAISYAAGCIQSFLTDGHLSQEKALSLYASKIRIQASLDIRDEEGRIYLEILNRICGDVLTAAGYSESRLETIKPEPKGANAPEVLPKPMESLREFKRNRWMQIGLTHLGVPRKTAIPDPAMAYCYVISTGTMGEEREPCWILAAVSEDAVVEEIKRVSRTPVQNLDELKALAEDYKLKIQ